MKHLFIILALSLTLSACTSFSLIHSGPQRVGDMQVSPVSQWNKAPFKLGPKTEVWTRDGLNLNSLIFIYGIESGQPLFKVNNRELPMPAYRSDMLPNELAELVETSIRNMRGGKPDVKSSGLRPVTIANQTAFRFNINYTDNGGLAKAGDVVALQKNDQIYIIIFDAAALHYRQKELNEIDALFDSMAF